MKILESLITLHYDKKGANLEKGSLSFGVV